MNNIITIIISATLTGIAQQPVGLGWLAWFSLLPLFSFINNTCRFIKFVKIGFIWGFFYNLTILFWIAQNLGTNLVIGVVSMFSSVILFSLNIILVLSVSYFLKLKVGRYSYLFLPLIWVSVEYLRSFGTLANPWISLANTQLDYLTLIQNVEITGIYGITFWIVSVNLMFYEWYYKKNIKSAFSLLFIFCIPWVTGLFLTPQPIVGSQNSINITVVQPNVHLSDKRNKNNTSKNITRLLELSQDKHKRLIIWPETSTMTYLSDGNIYLKQIKDFLLQSSSELLTGLPVYTLDKNGKYNYFNSIAHISSDSILNIYNKIHLVPMGEYIPLSKWFPSLKALNLGQANFTHGDKYTIFNYGENKLGGLVCLESTFPQLNRKFIKNGAEVLFYVVNDGWYETPPQPQQHARQTIYRAIEFRRPIIRCANTGISQIVNSSGKIIKQTTLNKSEFIKSSVVPNSELTFYAIYGDVFSWINIFILIILFFRRKVHVNE